MNSLGAKSTSGGAIVARLIISVADLTRARAFYVGVLGIAARDEQPGLAHLETGDGVKLMLHERPSAPSDAAIAISFTVADLDAAVVAAGRTGAVTIDPPAVQPWGERMAVLKDPDGHIVCLVEQDAAGR